MSNICRNCGRQIASKDLAFTASVHEYRIYDGFCFAKWGTETWKGDCLDHTVDWFARAQQNQLAADAWAFLRANPNQRVGSQRRGRGLWWRCGEWGGFGSLETNPLDAVLAAMKVKP